MNRAALAGALLAALILLALHPSAWILVAFACCAAGLALANGRRLRP